MIIPNPLDLSHPKEPVPVVAVFFFSVIIIVIICLFCLVLVFQPCGFEHRYNRSEWQTQKTWIFFATKRVAVLKRIWRWGGRPLTVAKVGYPPIAVCWKPLCIFSSILKIKLTALILHHFPPCHYPENHHLTTNQLIGNVAYLQWNAHVLIKKLLM